MEFRWLFGAIMQLLATGNMDRLTEVVFIYYRNQEVPTNGAGSNSCTANRTMTSLVLQRLVYTMIYWLLKHNRIIIVAI